MLVCVQGLLKVAIDNARAQEKQVQLEKTELKMELYRERELRETLERQLCVEQKNRGHYCTQTLIWDRVKLVIRKFGTKPDEILLSFGMELDIKSNKTGYFNESRLV